MAELETATLTGDELKLLENYRALSPNEQKNIMTIVERGELSKIAASTGNYHYVSNNLLFHSTNIVIKCNGDCNGDI